MRILVFGSSGMLGHKLIQRLGRDHEVWGTLRGGFTSIEHFGFLDESRCIGSVDAGNETQIRQTLETAKPDIVINAVGIVKQVQTAKDVVATLTVNSIFPHRLAHFSNEFGFKLITISTDCVFDGKKGNYKEQDIPNAIDLYGKSKELGEVSTGRALTLRTSIIGRELESDHGLVEWFLSNKGKTVKGFRQAIYSGFPTIVLADIISRLVLEFPDLVGLHHVSSDPINKDDLLRLLNKYYGSNIEIEPSDELQIDRSLNSEKFRIETDFTPKTWEEMIESMVADPTPYDRWK